MKNTRCVRLFPSMATRHLSLLLCPLGGGRDLCSRYSAVIRTEKLRYCWPAQMEKGSRGVEATCNISAEPH